MIVMRRRLLPPEALLKKEEFEIKEIKLDNIFLDPNNPRFSLEKPVPDGRITEKSIQDSVLKNVKKFDTDSLKDSIRRLGFLPIDKVVVRLIEGMDGKYVVVEGNRRIAALKELDKAHREGELSLPKEIYDTIVKFEVLVYKGKSKDISWLIQGVRHISGVHRWGGLEQGELLHKLVKEAKMGLGEAASAVGIKSGEATKYLKSYIGYRQFKEFEEGEGLRPENFVFLIEGIFRRVRPPTKFQKWLRWDDKKEKFKSTENVKEFLTWITPPHEDAKARIDSKSDMLVVEKAMEYHQDQFKKFREDESYQVEPLKYEIWRREYTPAALAGWEEKLGATEKDLRALPTVDIKLSDKKGRFIEMLKKIERIIKEHLEALQ